MFISFVLLFVYGIGVGLARLIYILNASKDANQDSYWRPVDKTQLTSDLSAPY